jgi:hypothetical protein
MFWIVCAVVLLLLCPFPAWFRQCAWYRCLGNWVLYRRWVPCRHAEMVPRPVPRPARVPRTEVQWYAFACVHCGAVFFWDTVDNWRAEIASLSLWERVWFAAPGWRATSGGVRRKESPW